MSSQLDLDRGGTFRQFHSVWMGPSVGWQSIPKDNVLVVTTPGTTVALQGTTLIQVNINASVTVQLPKAKAPPNIPAGGLPGPSYALPITVVDVLGSAGTNPITVQAAAGETIAGNSSVTISSNFGGYTLTPDVTAGEWVPAISSLNPFPPLTHNHFLVGSVTNQATDVDGGVAEQLLLFTQNGTGAVQRFLDSKVKDFLSVKDFGAVGDGSTDDTSAIQTALTAASNAGVATYFPGGTYKVSSNINLPVNAQVIGAGIGNTIIKTTSATANVFTTTGADTNIGFISFQSSVTRTAGAYVVMQNGNSSLHDFYMTGGFIGVNLISAQATVTIENGIIYDSINSTGVSILINAPATDLVIRRVSMTVSSLSITPAAHIQILNIGDLTLIDIQTYHANNCLLINPSGTTQVGHIRAVACYWDTAITNGVLFNPSNTASIKDVSFIGCWFSGATAGSGFSIFNPGTAVAIDGLTIVEGAFFGNTFGIFSNVGGGTLTNFIISNCRFAGNSSAGIVLDAWSNVLITGNRIGTCDGFGPNPIGIDIAVAGATNIQIIGNNLSANTTAITNASTQTTNRIESNIGYNPVGASAPTSTGTTGAVITAGPSPETHYIRQSATFDATAFKGGQQLGSVTNSAAPMIVQLGPNDTYQVTWTTTQPTYTKDVH